MRKFSFFMMFIIVLAGCANRSAYQKAKDVDHRGYTDAQLDQDRWLVTYNARDAGYSYDKVKELWLLRAANVADEAGYSYFIIVHNDVYANPLLTLAGERKYQHGGTISYEIKGFKVKPATGDTYNAKMVIKTIGPKYPTK